MMINLIIAQNIPDVFPVFFDNHLLGATFQRRYEHYQGRTCGFVGYTITEDRDDEVCVLDLSQVSQVWKVIYKLL